MKRRSLILILLGVTLLFLILILGCVALGSPAITQKRDAAIPNDFILVEGGTFRMGDEKGDLRDDCQPLHTVTVDSFVIGKYEVTQTLYKKVTGNNPSCFSADGDNRPVEKVSWYDAIEFCNKLSKRERLAPAYFVDKDGNDCRNWTVTWNKNANGYRLPTEAEWEYAARGGKKSNGYLYSGSDSIKTVCWFDVNTAEDSRPVGGKQANELGIFDMSGNVWEWCWDWYGDYPAEPQTSSDGVSSGEFRIRRGGCGYYWERECRVATRGWYGPEKSSNFTGFRLVLPCP